MIIFYALAIKWGGAYTFAIVHMFMPLPQSGEGHIVLPLSVHGFN